MGLFFRNKNRSKEPPPLPPDETSPSVEAQLASERLAEDPELKKALIQELEGAAEGEINQVEAAIIMMQLGVRTLETVLHSLVDAELSVLFEDQQSTDEPLVLPGGGEQPYLALFTTPARAKLAQERFPTFTHFGRTQFSEIITSLSSGIGIVVNPFEKAATIQFPPQHTEALRADIQDKR
ncbi:MAG: hypothetical protein AAF591_13815 [Verrucomicrobiota bacterium]